MSSAAAATASASAANATGSDSSAAPQLPACLVILGRQGSGKGTQSLKLCEKFNLVHVSTGDILRETAASDTELGRKLKRITDSGELVSDDMMCEILETRVAQPDIRAKGVLLDGFPRTEAQAESLVGIVGEVDLVVNLDVPIDVVTQRMLERNRTDDTAESINRRLSLYEEQTQPLLQWYQRVGQPVETVDGVGSEAEVFERLTTAVAPHLSHLSSEA